MGLTPAPKGHDWSVAATNMAEPPVPVAVIVCRRCGLIRTGVAAPRRESKIDVSGSCPG